MFLWSTSCTCDTIPGATNGCSAGENRTNGTTQKTWQITTEGCRGWPGRGHPGGRAGSLRRRPPDTAQPAGLSAGRGCHLRLLVGQAPAGLALAEERLVAASQPEAVGAAPRRRRTRGGERPARGHHRPLRPRPDGPNKRAGRGCGGTGGARPLAVAPLLRLALASGAAGRAGNQRERARRSAAKRGACRGVAPFGFAEAHPGGIRGAMRRHRPRVGLRGAGGRRERGRRRGRADVA